MTSFHSMLLVLLRYIKDPNISYATKSLCVYEAMRLTTILLYSKQLSLRFNVQTHRMRFDTFLIRPESKVCIQERDDSAGYQS